MPTYHLYLDSRERIAGPPCQPSFVLSNSIIGVKSVEVRSFHFANTLFNVDNHNNILETSDGVITMPPGFYSATDFVSALDTLLQLHSSFVQAHVTLAQATNQLQWTLPPMFSILGGSMIDIVGYYGASTTQLVLAGPHAIQVQCQELQTHARNVTARRTGSGDGTLNPLFMAPVSVGFGAMENYDPSYRMAHQYSHGILNRLNFSLSDARTGRLLTELTTWSIIIIVVVND